MTKVSPMLLAAGVVLMLVFSLTAQTTKFVGPELLNTPSIFIPDEAELSGLGGLVRVRLSIDENGNVTSVEQVTGPGWTCPLVTRPDVVAMRDAATKAAMLGKFSPATLNGLAISSSITLNFDFPADESMKQKPAHSGLWASSPPSRRPNQEEVKGIDALSARNTTDGPMIAVRRNDYLLASNAGKRRIVPGQVSGGVLNGKAETLVKPLWPPAAHGITGTVTVQTWIDINGEVFSAETISGHPLLRFASASAACQSKFSPTTLSGNPVRVYGVIVYRFIK